MHILYIHQHFALPSGTTGTRSYEFARRWVDAGHKVTIITGHYSIGGLTYSEAPQMIDGINVIISGMPYSNNMSIVRRLWVFLSFMFYAAFAGAKIEDIDIVFATSTPLTIGIPAMWISWVKRIPMVFEVRDQWPRIPIDMGYIKNKFLIITLRWLERFIYLRSSAVVALSPGMASGVNDVLRGEKREIVTASNCCDLTHFYPGIDGDPIRLKYGWGEKMVFLHAGAMGKANGLDFILDVAAMLKDVKHYHFVIVGEGSEKIRLCKRVQDENLNNVEIIGPIRKTLLSQFIAAANVSLVIFADYPILEENSANKFFDALSAGNPILLNYSGWQREVLELGHAGYGCKQYCKTDFIDNLNLLYKNRDTLDVMAKNAREIACVEFSRDVLAKRVLSLLTRVCQ